MAVQNVILVPNREVQIGKAHRIAVRNLASLSLLKSAVLNGSPIILCQVPIGQSSMNLRGSGGEPVGL